MNNSLNMNKNKIRIILCAILLLIAAVIWSVFLIRDNTPTAAENSRALIGGPFNLTNHLNQPVSDQDFQGKYRLMYFGYTYCPDICPMDLQIMADALDLLEPEILGQISPMFISVDPERDTFDVMATYVDYFHKDLIGLTGTVEQINAVKSEYRVYAAKADDSPDYIVDHTSYTYLMDKNGTYLDHFNHAEDPEKMAAKITALVR